MNSYMKKIFIKFLYLTVCLLFLFYVINIFGQEIQIQYENSQNIFLSEKMVVDRILYREQISTSNSLNKFLKAQLAFTIGTNGEVLEIQVKCGDDEFAKSATQSLMHWKFKPWTGFDGSLQIVKAQLTFELRGNKSGLIWDFRDYPITEKDAKSLLDAFPKIHKYLKIINSDPDLYLDVDYFPEERNGIFYLFHLYTAPPEESMTFTIGWYEVNAYTGEVWDSLFFHQFNSKLLNKRRSSILRASKFNKAVINKYKGISPWDKRLEGLVENPCSSFLNTIK
jgi:hypothetical protein